MAKSMTMKRDSPTKGFSPATPEIEYSCCPRVGSVSLATPVSSLPFCFRSIVKPPWFVPSKLPVQYPAYRNLASERYTVLCGHPGQHSGIWRIRIPLPDCSLVTRHRNLRVCHAVARGGDEGGAHLQCQSVAGLACRLDRFVSKSNGRSSSG